MRDPLLTMPDDPSLSRMDLGRHVYGAIQDEVLALREALMNLLHSEITRAGLEDLIDGPFCELKSLVGVHVHGEWFNTEQQELDKDKHKPIPL